MSPIDPNQERPTLGVTASGASPAFPLYLPATSCRACGVTREMVDDARQLECDIVMKGGITQRCRLPPRGGAPLEDVQVQEHRWRVGLRDRGRIRRRGRDGSRTGGLRRIGELPAELGQELQYLFQPTKRTSSAYDVLMAFVEPKRALPNKLLRTLLICLRAAWVVASTVFVVVMIPGLGLALGFDGRNGTVVDWGQRAPARRTLVTARSSRDGRRGALSHGTGRGIGLGGQRLRPVRRPHTSVRRTLAADRLDDREARLCRRTLHRYDRSGSRSCRHPAAHLR